MGRNLKNPGVENAIKFNFEDHKFKIISGLACLITKRKISIELVEDIINLSINLEIGREKSMYVDVNDKNEITIPSQMTRPEAADDAVRLAKECLECTSEILVKNKPVKTSAAQDKHLTLNKHKLIKMYANANFRDYYFAQIEKNAKKDFSEIAVKYHDEFYCKDKLFKKEQ